VKVLAKKAIRKLGFELHRYLPTTSPSAQLMMILEHQRVNLVFDVGANVGRYALSLRNDGYSGRIVSFEPMKAAHDALLAAAEGDSLWQVAPRAALGAHDGEIEMHVAANSESSSILEMLAVHAEAHPASAYIGVEKVPLRTLDALAAQHLGPDARLLVKIDTQGYEDQVIAGASETLERAAVLQLELSLVPLYAGQKLMAEMVAMLEAAGFDLWGVAPVFADSRSGRMLQLDGVFCRRAPLP
jgi:FkbM family methyltransferase